MTTKLNIVVPMAGMGSRFSNEGYDLPKPFIDVDGKMMIERVLDNLAYEGACYILIVRSEHMKKYPHLFEKLSQSYTIKFIELSKLTLGAACTVLSAHELIFNDIPLMIANSDQIVDIKIADFINDCFTRNLSGSILTFEDSDPKWSFAKVNSDGLVTEVKEKQPISTIATVGIYLFARGQDFVRGAIDMLVENDTFNSEFYVAPVYNYLIQKALNIGIFSIEMSQMHGTGTPKDLSDYLTFRNSL
jgi:UDP-N-acetylglucosamine diphosphorylase / glucose-1-phosphate thymidylyltransferase / UDP-N-acetylgalactosamine diphosphorylase / glucosamine-1-phosphate N-acetyltransferase / galactosamine-1-phosphate N-acetyltransferase